jgi:hypothetical protein
MLVASGVFIQSEHDDELRILVAPAYRRFQTRYADGGLLNIFRFSVRNCETKAQPGGKDGFTCPQVGLQLTRLAAAAGQ